LMFNWVHTIIDGILLSFDRTKTTVVKCETQRYYTIENIIEMKNIRAELTF
jgi:hypothetical protein